jgi:putative DNA-binding protein
MKLMQLQRTMARAVMQPLTSSERMQGRAPGGGPMKRYASRFIKPNDRLSSFERLEIYNRQYWFRVLAALGEDFPGLRAVLGQRRFDAMARAYLIANPSRSFTLRNLGSRMESWLRKNPKWAGPHQKLALDIARLEWADIEAFDGKTEPPLRPDDLSSAAGPRMKLTLQPYVRLLSFCYPVDDLLLEVRKEDEDTDFASNTFQEHRKRKRVRAVAKLEPAQIFLAVHRIDYSVYFRRLDQEEFSILTALRHGKTLAAAVELAFRGSQILPEQRPLKVQTWFQTWSTLGWFCRPEKKRAAR